MEIKVVSKIKFGHFKIAAKIINNYLKVQFPSGFPEDIISSKYVRIIS